jgi:hypothetical protein
MKLSNKIFTILLLVFSFTTKVSLGDNQILDKESALNMFSMSKENWNKNAVQLKTMGIGHYEKTIDGSLTLYYRPDPLRGYLIVTPTYGNKDNLKPFKISVTILNDKKNDNFLYNSMLFKDVQKLILTTSNQMQPEFSVMGHLKQGAQSSLNFTIFEKGRFPIIDKQVEKGKVCPPRNKKQMCILKEAK